MEKEHLAECQFESSKQRIQFLEGGENYKVHSGECVPFSIG
jgi:hypothetical protein